MAEATAPRRLPLRTRLALVGLGAVAATGLAPLGIWPLTVLALAGGLDLIGAARTPVRAAWAGWWLGLGWFGLGLSWIVEPFLVEPEIHGWMAPFALVFMAGGLALFWAFAAWLGHRLAGPSTRPLALAVTLTVAEYLRSVVLTGFPWNLPGHVWVGTGVDRIAALLGAHGLTLLTLLLACLPLLVRRGSPVRVVAAGGLAVVLPWLVGSGLAALLPPVPPEPGAPVVRLVQPNAPQDEKWDPEKSAVFFARQLDYTAATPLPDLTVWPETSVPAFLEFPGTTLEDIAEAAQGVPVVFGIQRVRGPRFFNSLVVLNRGAVISDVYDKHHLVPFGEYMPLGDRLGPLFARFGIRGLAANDGGGFTAGEGLRIVDLPGIGPALPLICYEGIFPHELGRYDRRPRLMMLITNDAWFGTVSGPYQHLAQARLRAVEQGLPMVRVANTGVSGVLGPRGEVLGAIGLGEAGFSDVPLPPALAPTPYARWGDWPMILLLVAALVGLAARPRRRAD